MAFILFCSVQFVTYDHRGTIIVTWNEWNNNSENVGLQNNFLTYSLKSRKLNVRSFCQMLVLFENQSNNSIGNSEAYILWPEGI